MKTRSLVALAALACAVGLAVASGKKSDMPDDPFATPGETTFRDRPRPVARRAARAGLPYPPCPAPPGVIHRRHLLQILSRSPGVFLSGLDVQMVPAGKLPGGPSNWKTGGSKHKTGRFGGWRIRKFHPGDPCLGRTGIRFGDIVVGVNDFAISRPRDLVKVWQSLRSAPRIIVRLYRSGEPLVFVVKIKD